MTIIDATAMVPPVPEWFLIVRVVAPDSIVSASSLDLSSHEIEHASKLGIDCRHGYDAITTGYKSPKAQMIPVPTRNVSPPNCESICPTNRSWS